MRTTSLYLTTALSIAAGVCWMQPAAATEDFGFMTLGGYARQDFSFNLQKVPEDPKSSPMDLSMNRQTLFVEAFAPIGQTRWTTRLRWDHEFQTSYEHDLEVTANLKNPMGGRIDFTREYDTNTLGDAVRELFVDYDIGRLSARLGRQQVVWGETDFFHATDVIHGYDFRWRHFLEPANEDVRKPLTLANLTFDAKELNGKLQLIVRPPGIDRDHQVANTDPAFGGRWSNNISKTTPLFSYANPSWLPYDYHWKDGDVDNPHYGGRWAGEAFGQSYALNYYHGQGGFMSDPIIIVDPKARGLFGPVAVVFPETDTFGGSASGNVPFIDSIYRAEVAYTPNRKFGNWPFLQVVKNDAYNFEIGLDKTLRLQNYLGTSSQSLFTVQMFDWYLPNVQPSQRIVNFVGSGYFAEHNFMGTMILQLPYMHDTLTGTFVGLADLTWGGGMIIPSLEYAIADHWRLKGELDLPIGGKKGDINALQNQSTFGIFYHNPQLLLRTTFLF